MPRDSVEVGSLDFARFAWRRLPDALCGCLLHGMEVAQQEFGNRYESKVYSLKEWFFPLNQNDFWKVSTAYSWNLINIKSKINFSQYLKRRSFLYNFFNFLNFRVFFTFWNCASLNPPSRTVSSNASFLSLDSIRLVRFVQNSNVFFFICRWHSGK